MSKITGVVGITSRSDGFIYINLKDDASKAQFVEIKMSREQFADAITGTMVSDIEMEVRGLAVVGMQRVRETRSVLCPLATYKKELLQEWLTDNCQEEGWTIDPYLGSQGSTKQVDDGTILNYALFKYVEAGQ